MAEYIITTESTTDLSKQLETELDIKILPLTYNLDGVETEDTPSSDNTRIKEFYNKLRNGSLSSTSQINFQTFIDEFSKYLKEGKDVLHIGFSSGLSGTCSQAILAAKELKEEFPDRKVIVVDTLAASLGEGMLAYYAAKLRLDGKSIDEVAQWLEDNKLRQAHWFSVDDLNFLKRGGRVSPAVALVGSLLNIKPIMHVDNEGHLTKVGTVRGRKASLDELVKRASLTIENATEQTIFICHGDCEQDAQYVADKMKQDLGVKDVIIGYTGPVIGSHSGPGTIALFTLGKGRD